MWSVRSELLRARAGRDAVHGEAGVKGQVFDRRRRRRKGTTETEPRGVIIAKMAAARAQRRHRISYPLRPRAPFSDVEREELLRGSFLLLHVPPKQSVDVKSKTEKTV